MANPWEKYQPQQPQGITFGTPDPTVPLDRQIKQGQINAQQRDAQTAADEARRKKAEADKAEQDAISARAKNASGNPLEQLAAKRLGQDELLATLEDARREINSGILPAAGFGSSISRAIGGTAGTDLAGSLSTIGSAVTLARLGDLKAQSATGASGLGALSEKEAAFLRDSIASLDQSQSKEKLLDSFAKIELHYRRLNALADGQDPDKPEVGKAYGIVGVKPSTLDGKGGSGGGGNGSPPAVSGPGGAPTSEGRTVIDPALAGVNTHVAALIKGGATGQQVRAYLDTVQPGLAGRAQNIDQWVDYHKQNPNKPISVQVDRVFQPNTGITKTLGDIGMSPVGTGVINAANMLTGNNLDSLTGDPALARATIDGVNQQNPTSAFIGQFGGGALAAGGIEASLAKAGFGTGARVIGSDALFGGISGAGANDDNRLGGAVAGTVAGVGGGMFGRNLTRGAGRAISGVTDAGKQYLNRAGIPLTMGQTLGGVAKGLEDRLAGFPIVGDAINARRQAGIDGFNKAAFKEALAPIGTNTAGQIGESGIQNAQDAVSDAYRKALSGVRVQGDPQFAQEMQAAINAGRSIPKLGDDFGHIVNSDVAPMFGPGASLTGENMQAAVQGLRQARAGYQNVPLGHKMGDALGSTEDAITGLVGRQAPDVMPAYDAANGAYRNLSTLENAVNRSVNTGGTFTPAQLGMAARQNTIAYGGKKAAAAGERPFFDLQRAGQDVLPSKIPDSGTAGRYAIPAALGIVGGGGGAVATEGDAGDKAKGGIGYGLTAAALAAAPYSKPAQALLQKALLSERPDLVVNFGNLIGKRARLGGMFASPLAIDYAGGQ